MSGFYSTKTSVHSNLCLVLLSRLVEVFLFLPIFGSHFIDITGQQQIKKHDLNTGGAASVRAVIQFNFVWLAVIFSSFRLVERNPLKYISRTQNSASARWSSYNETLKLFRSVFDREVVRIQTGATYVTFSFVCVFDEFRSVYFKLLVSASIIHPWLHHIFYKHKTFLLFYHPKVATRCES